MKPNDFQEKVKMEMKNAKKVLYKEEIYSALMAILFAVNMCAIFMTAFSVFTLINVGLAWFAMKKFRITVKKQFILAKHLQFLKDSMKEKVWTPKD